MTQLFPAIFVSHGSPMLALEDGPAHRFLRELGVALGVPRAVLVLSAHWETRHPLASVATHPETIHDFGGFPRQLYDIAYPCPGAPDVAADAAGRTGGGTDPDRGLDHGAWVPLSLMYPDASVPVAQLSIQSHLGPEHHHRVGTALRPLREDGVLILASGSLTHNLREFFGRGTDAAAPGAAVPDWVTAFADWTADAVTAGRTADLLAYRAMAPHAVRNHPTDEHLLPLFAALGAGTPSVPGRVLHRSTAGRVLAMDAYRFD